MGAVQQVLASYGSAGGMNAIAYGTFTGSGSTGTQDVTGLGGTPGLVLIWSNRRTTAGNATDNALMSFGAAIPGGAKITAAVADDTGEADSRTSRGFRSDYVLMGLTITADTQNGVIDTLTGLADGFRVNWTVANSSIYHYMAFPDALDVAVGTFDIATSTGTQDITGLGFDPSLVLFLASIENTTEGVTSEFNFSLGAGVSSTRRAGGNWYSRDNSANSVAKGQITASQVVVQTNGSTNDCAVDYEGSITGGFRVDVTTAPAASTRIGYIALGGAGLSVDVGTFVNKTSPDGNLAYTGVGFEPNAMLYFGRGPTALDTLQGACQLAIGAATSPSNRGFSGSGAVDNSATMTCASQTSLTRAIGSIGGTNALSNIADLVSFDSDGWTFSWASTGAGATHHGYVAMRYTP